MHNVSLCGTGNVYSDDCEGVFELSLYLKLFGGSLLALDMCLLMPVIFNAPERQANFLIYIDHVLGFFLVVILILGEFKHFFFYEYELL